MKLMIKNLAKISYADIAIDGITVIAGNNNTGKSTVGKTLNAMFNAGVDQKAKMERARANRLGRELERLIMQGTAALGAVREMYSGRMSRGFWRKLAAELLAAESAAEEKDIFIHTLVQKNRVCKENTLMAIMDSVLGIVEETKRIPEEEFSKNFYVSYFQDTFNQQINSVFDRDSVAEISLDIKGKKIELEFRNDQCIAFRQEIDILHSSVYIENPLIIDHINDFPYEIYENNRDRMLCSRLKRNSSANVEESVLARIIAEDRLKEVSGLLDKVVSGQIVESSTYMYQFSDSDSSELDVRSLSTGIKSFAILKQLLTNDVLQDQDVIVLDEPEIHLHPEWQMIYAEVIVLLQKEFDFNIVITTHSSHFLEAVELYSRKHGIRQKCRYYLADRSEGYGYTFQDVTEHLDTIYRQLVTPALLLDRLREELDAEDDEL